MASAKKVAFMGRFEKIAADVALLAPSQQDALADLVNAALEYAKPAGASSLNEAQLAELQRLIDEPSELASDEEVEAVFASFSKSFPR
jgi:DNA-binding protein YbaB